MNFIYYFLILILSLYISLFCYVKIKYHFWNIQPVFHYYNLFYWFMTNRIINEDLPIANRYCNMREIHTYKFDELTNIDKQYIINFLKNFFLRTKNVNYLPSMTSFESNFDNHSYPSFVSIYSNNANLFDYKKNNIIDFKEIISVMTTRPLYISLYNKDFPVYYVDYLCVHNLYRKKGIAPQIIQTHELNQRHNNKKIKVSLFKREGEINGIVPLVFYNTYGYKKLDIYKINDHSISVVKVTKSSVHHFLEFFKAHKHLFDCCITPHISNLISLIESKSMFIYILKQDSTILGCYIFKDTDTLYNNKKSIECISSINSIKNDKSNLFYRGFTLAYHNIAKQIKSRIILIENVAHNNLIIKHISTSNDNSNNPYLFLYSPTAFFLYNYVAKPTNNDKFIYIY